MQCEGRATCLVSIKSFVGISNDHDIHTIVVWIRVMDIEKKGKH